MNNYSLLLRILLLLLHLVTLFACLDLVLEVTRDLTTPSKRILAALESHRGFSIPHNRLLEAG